MRGKETCDGSTFECACSRALGLVFGVLSSVFGFSLNAIAHALVGHPHGRYEEVEIKSGWLFKKVRLLDIDFFVYRY